MPSSLKLRWLSEKRSWLRINQGKSIRFFPTPQPSVLWPWRKPLAHPSRARQKLVRPECVESKHAGTVVATTTQLTCPLFTCAEEVCSQEPWGGRGRRHRNTKCRALCPVDGGCVLDTSSSILCWRNKAGLAHIYLMFTSIEAPNSHPLSRLLSTPVPCPPWTFLCNSSRNWEEPCSVPTAASWVPALPVFYSLSWPSAAKWYLGWAFACDKHAQVLVTGRPQESQGGLRASSICPAASSL